MTPAQDKFLRAFAEKLGLPVVDNPATYGRHHLTITHPDICLTDDNGKVRKEKLAWLAHPCGQEYLVQRAQEEGVYQRTVTYWSDESVSVAFLGLDGITSESESWATARAVAKALYGLEMEEG